MSSQLGSELFKCGFGKRRTRVVKPLNFIRVRLTRWSDADCGKKNVLERACDIGANVKAGSRKMPRKIDDFGN